MARNQLADSGRMADPIDDPGRVSVAFTDGVKAGDLGALAARLRAAAKITP